ncbi:MAG: DUF1343 domain-containing protein [Proteobacteria bacterium]|nr:DUF1343 domain-containing protein [Pseudomonadota bacterium]
MERSSVIPVKTGLENFVTSSQPEFANKKIGLLCNPASVDSRLRHARDLIHNRFPGQLKALFSPQHGFFAEKQDNMIESGHLTDRTLHIPVFSLYGETRVPEKEMFDLIDALIIDLMDVGTRVYTFIYTVSYCLETAKKFGRKIIILDRPNPINGISIEGNLLNPDFSSFVGRYPIPMRHGLTMGELALFINREFGIDCELDVIRLSGWKRNMYYEDTGLPWVPPSPNLPTPGSALVYPGQVIFEGTNISEGRGTTQPFLLFGAPFLDTEEITKILGGNLFPGAILRPVVFEPTSNKWSGQACQGFQIHVTDSEIYNAYETTLTLLQAIIRSSGDAFKWKSPPYEYEYEKLPVDLIIGDQHIREKIETMIPLEDIFASFKPDIDRFRSKSAAYHLYE